MVVFLQVGAKFNIEKLNSLRAQLSFNCRSVQTEKSKQHMGSTVMNHHEHS